MSTISTSMDLPATPGQSPQPASISVQDIQNLLIVIDTAAQRGAFKGNELSQIGQLFDKVNMFLQAATPQQTNPVQPTAQETIRQRSVAIPESQPTMTPVDLPMMPPFAPKIGA